MFVSHVMLQLLFDAFCGNIIPKKMFDGTFHNARFANTRCIRPLWAQKLKIR